MIIYKITNKFNGKVYIGKTTRSLEKRKEEHIKYAKKHKNFILYRAINKYGIDNFEFEIIDETDNKNELTLLEQKYIKQYNSYIGFEICNGYNMTRGGEGGFINENHPNKKEIYKKIGRSNSGDKHFLNKMNYDEREEFLNKYRRGKNNPSYNKPRTKKQLEAARINGKTSFLGKKHTKETKRKMSINGKGKNSGEKNINYGKTGSKNKFAKKYIVTFPSGNEVFVHGMIEFCNEYGLIQQNMCQVATGRNTNHKGYKCRYYDKEKDKNIKDWKEIKNV